MPSRLLLVLCAGLCATTRGVAQTIGQRADAPPISHADSQGVKPSQPHWPDMYLTLALGSGSMDLSGLLGITLQKHQWAAALRFAGNFPSGGEPVASDFGLLIGYAHTRHHVRTALSAGVAAVSVGDSARTYTTPYNQRTVIGLPLQAELFWRPTPGFGLGALAVGQINAQRSFWSLQLGLQLGRFE